MIAYVTWVRHKKCFLLRGVKVMQVIVQMVTNKVVRNIA